MGKAPNHSAACPQALIDVKLSVSAPYYKGPCNRGSAWKWENIKNLKIEGEAFLDLDYPEDVAADIDLNVVMNGKI